MAHLPSDVKDMFQYSGNMLREICGGGCWEEGLWGGLVDYSAQLMLGGGLVRKEAVK